MRDKINGIFSSVPKLYRTNRNREGIRKVETFMQELRFGETSNRYENHNINGVKQRGNLGHPIYSIL